MSLLSPLITVLPKRRSHFYYVGAGRNFPVWNSADCYEGERSYPPEVAVVFIKGGNGEAATRIQMWSANSCNGESLHCTRDKKIKLQRGPLILTRVWNFNHRLKRVKFCFYFYFFIVQTGKCITSYVIYPSPGNHNVLLYWNIWHKFFNLFFSNNVM
jgi:hypothetical protein